MAIRPELRDGKVSPISIDNWVNYGGEFFSHTGAEATPDEQIIVAMRIQKNAPDQNGCNGGW
jgi:hypothetical protein